MAIASVVNSADALWGKFGLLAIGALTVWLLFRSSAAGPGGDGVIWMGVGADGAIGGDVEPNPLSVVPSGPVLDETGLVVPTYDGEGGQPSDWSNANFISFNYIPPGGNNAVVPNNITPDSAKYIPGQYQLIQQLSPILAGWSAAVAGAAAGAPVKY